MFRPRQQGRFSKEFKYHSFPRQNVSKYKMSSHISSHPSISDRSIFTKSASHYHTNSHSNRQHRKLCQCHSCHSKSHFHSSPHLYEQAQIETETEIIHQTEDDNPPSDPRRETVQQSEETRNIKIESIVDEIAKLNLMEVATLVSALKAKLNLPDTAMMGAAMPMGAMPAGGAPAAAGTAEEAEPEITQTIFDIILKSYPAEKKVSIIKEVRGIYKLGLKEAKALVEKAPCTLQAQAPKVEADEVKEKLESFGAEVELD